MAKNLILAISFGLKLNSNLKQAADPYNDRITYGGRAEMRPAIP